MTQIQLLPLGTAEGRGNLEQQHSSYLIKITQNGTEKQVLLDCGAERAGDSRYVDSSKLELIIFSHSHHDHTKNFGSLLQMLIHHGRLSPLIVVAHPKAWKRIKNNVMRNYNLKIPDFIRFQPINIRIGVRIPFFLFKNRYSFTNFSQVREIEPITLNFSHESDVVVYIKGAPAKHVDDAIATRIKFSSSNKGEKLLDIVYSPDTSNLSTHLVSFAQNSDYWMLDSTHNSNTIDRMKLNGHSCPEYSGKLCESAGVRNFIVIHYLWTRQAKKFDETESEIKKSVKRYYSGRIIVAKDLQPVMLKP